jgi:hypothetical protein
MPMGDRQDDGSEFVPWLAAWLDQRMQLRPEGAATGELTWPQLSAMLQPDALGVFFVLLELAGGQKQFTMHPEDVLALLSMTATRFDQVTERLVRCGLVETWPSGESVEWRVVRAPATH